MTRHEPEELAAILEEVSVDEAKLSAEGRRLWRPHERVSALAAICARLVNDDSLTRDQVSALTSARRCIEKIGDLQVAHARGRHDIKLGRKLAELQRALDRQHNPSSTSFVGDWEPPRLSEGDQ